MRIGVFDSGIGGITVLTEIRKKLGPVDYVYLGDTAHVPYGTKSSAQVERLSVDCARILKAKKVDALVVACNTASSLAIGAIRQAMSPIPVFGMVEPGVEAVLNELELRGASSTLLVLATRATVRSGAYGVSLKSRLNVDYPVKVIEQACPLLVPMIEEGWVDHPVLHETLKVYVSPHLIENSTGVALLGCTHYPWIKAAIEKSLPGWTVVDSAHAVALALERSEVILKSPSGTSYRGTSGKIEWIFTDPEAVPAFASKMMMTMNSEQ